jgi:predicted DNA-binding transcriptional regulator YafY
MILSFVSARIGGMSETSGRLLRLLSFLQTGRDWSADELANRLGVTSRTVRNDIGRLRDLGYQVDSMRGPGGGYWLGRGATIPPLLLDDEEAVAISLALRSAATGTVRGFEETATRALAKLAQMLPARLQSRVEALSSSVETVPGRGPEVAMELLDLIATACRDRQVLRFRYQRHDGDTGPRRVEPHRLISDGRRWYLLGWDPERDDWRTFRVDRISEARPRPGSPFRRRPIEDAADRVAAGTATAMWSYRARVIAHAPAETLLPRLPAGVQVEPIDAETCRLRVGSSDPETLTGYLGLLGVDFTVEDPDDHPELVEALRTMAERFRRASS